MLHLRVRARDDRRAINCAWRDDWRLWRVRTHRHVAEACLSAKQADRPVRIHRLASSALDEAVCCECRVADVHADGMAWYVEFRDWVRITLPARPHSNQPMYYADDSGLDWPQQADGG